MIEEDKALMRKLGIQAENTKAGLTPTDKTKLESLKAQLTAHIDKAK